MGKYINVDSKGNALPSIGKAQALIDDGAEITTPEFKENLICVVENGPFDAAAWAFCKDEFDLFNNPNDSRKKHWLVHLGVESLID